MSLQEQMFISQTIFKLSSVQQVDVHFSLLLRSDNNYIYFKTRQMSIRNVQTNFKASRQQLKIRFSASNVDAYNISYRQYLRHNTCVNHRI